MTYQYYIQTNGLAGWKDRNHTDNIEKAFELCNELKKVNITAQVVVREEEVIK